MNRGNLEQHAPEVLRTLANALEKGATQMKIKLSVNIPVPEGAYVLICKDDVGNLQITLKESSHIDEDIDCPDKKKIYGLDKDNCYEIGIDSELMTVLQEFNRVKGEN